MAAHLDGSHGTLVCRGTLVEKHWNREITESQYLTLIVETELASNIVIFVIDNGVCSERLSHHGYFFKLLSIIFFVFLNFFQPFSPS